MISHPSWKLESLREVDLFEFYTGPFWLDFGVEDCVKSQNEFITEVKYKIFLTYK